MCLTSEEKSNIKSNLSSLMDDRKATKKFMYANIFLLVVIGIWVGTIQTEVGHNTETIKERTADRFYRQDGEVLQAQINECSNRQARYEESIREINVKLDRLIERQIR